MGSPDWPRKDFSDMAADFKLPVLLVIGNKLGAINHALLTLNAIRNAAWNAWASCSIM
ncbi:MAG: AAA family ATPase [Akkermansia sp.]